MEKFVSQADLSKRWGISRQAVANRKSRHKQDWPKPIGKIGNIELYREKDVKIYEKKHPAK